MGLRKKPLYKVMDNIHTTEGIKNHLLKVRVFLP